MKHSLIFVATTPFAVNAFLRTHLLALARTYDVTLCVNTTAYPLVEEITHVVRVRHVDIARKIRPWQDLRALFQLLRCFREIRPSVVHSMTPKGGLLGMLAARLAGVPWRFHTFTGQVWANSTGGARRLLKAIDRLIAALSSRVFADSASQCRFLENEHVVQRGGVIVLGNGSIAGVDLTQFHSDTVVRAMLRAELNLPDDVPVFVFVGRLVRDKGVFDLVEAFAAVNAKNQQWALWMIGPDEDGIQAALQERGNQLGARIRWFGSTTTPERYMAAADVFVLPSYREGFGSVVIEAAACGIPSIAYQIDGVIDAIVDRKTGVFVEKGNVRDLADAMIWLGSDNNARTALGEAARTRAVREFSSSAVSAAWLDFYAALFKAAV
ncbi:glycosyltransferase family 4 protein [Rhodoferax saidenbachensis]|uniref:Glycosyltransferase n=1 Tax=Rhodoferax saidenbachensis TaxID=1484693 RepID=A0A1P8KDV4_9BURK|nr:glycosyltransferase family 4 protein [Rhodoferax saidenbachensis]APW44165.1 glycosyltransferase [Rhodoferax saidenbachensis]